MTGALEDHVGDGSSDIDDTRVAVAQKDVGSYAEVSLNPKWQLSMVLVTQGNDEVMVLLVGVPWDLERGADSERRHDGWISLEAKHVEESAVDVELPAYCVSMVGREERGCLDPVQPLLGLGDLSRLLGLRSLRRLLAHGTLLTWCDTTLRGVVLRG